MRHYIFFIMLLCTLIPTNGRSQSIEQILPSADPISTLICNCDQQRITIMYELDANRIGWLYYINPGNTALQKVQLPNGVELKDMECIGDTMYFGGANTATKQGLVGFFNVQDLFFNSGQIHFCEILPLWGIQGCHLPMIKKIDCYEYGTGIHIAFIGKMQLTEDTIGTIGEAIYDNIANTWDVSYFYNKEQRINYTDVTTTQNYVVAVGTDPEHQYIMQGWRQTSGFLYDPLFSGQISVANDNVNESKLFVTHIQNNEFAVTYEYSENNGIGIKINTHKVNTTNGFMFTAGMKVAPWTGHTNVIYDVAYQGQANNPCIMVVHRVYSSIYNSYFVSWFDYFNIWPNYHRAKHLNDKVTSIDFLRDWGYQLSGSIYSNPCWTLYRYDNLSVQNTCFPHESPTNAQNSVNITNIPLSIIIEIPHISTYTITPTVNSDSSYINCQTN